MNERRLIETIRVHVFVVKLPGMTPDRERAVIRSCWRLARHALSAGVPLAVAWGMVRQAVENVPARLRSEQERETFAAILQRIGVELFLRPTYLAN